MAVMIAVLIGIVAALTVSIIGAAVGVGMPAALSWGGGGFIAVAPLVLRIEQALGLL
ncbi:hypothetical protein OR263_35170 [Streptomyces sp. NEAU-H22]|uniref:hypothetical protein n=1 Tax=unclassified Streptomyces TaxID=2593676 RepID=UPI00225A8255|nr:MULTISPECIES: hypothetical protein [unclassified Streptomyces]MCX3291883.1 hypothetical protein [Streptomyces sp. NEAU-H22]WMD06904.1 hypothetical protein Q7C01_22110 [Streptomyces sp. FXY-T5]